MFASRIIPRSSVAAAGDRRFSRLAAADTIRGIPTGEAAVKRFLITLAIVAGGATAAWAGCGYPPIPPLPAIGCREMVPVCHCKNNGQCSWYFQCVRG